MMSLILPALGEWGDVIWAPVSGVLIASLFPKRKKIALFGFVEEILPFTDFIPTAYLAWRQEYSKTIL